MDFGSYNPKFEKDSLHDENIREIPIKYYGDYQKSPRKKDKKSSKLFFLLAIGFVVVVVLLFAIFDKSAVPKKHSSPITSSKAKPITPEKTLSYNSVASSLNFNYLASWSINDNNNGFIAITSPTSKLTLADGSKISGRVLISIDQQSQVPKTFGNYSLALSNSSLISYTSPTQYQRNQTYLTYVQYPATTIVGGLDAIYVTGDFGYSKGESIPATDMAKLNPLIIISFETCLDTACDKNSPATVGSDTYNSSLITTDTINVIKSLQLNWYWKPVPRLID